MVLMVMVPVLAALAGCGVSIGDECSSNYDCAAGRMVCDLNAPGGYCLREGCWENSDCPEDGVCVRFENRERYCMLGCDDTDDCRDGYTCIKDLLEQEQPAYCYIP